MIHPTAIIHPEAKIDPSTTIGPYCVIDAEVELGPGCRLGPHVHLTGQSRIGANNTFHTGCVVGDAPQDLKFNGEPTGLQIGNGNVFREHVTVHRSNQPGQQTMIGSRNFLMAHSHIGHNCHLGDSVVIANGALLGGHVSVADRVFISGNCLVHQFARIGTLAFMQGGSGISKDLPPFTIARGDNGLCGLNMVGLRRAGFTAEERLELKRLYHILFRSGRNLRDAMAAAQAEFASENARLMLDFISQSTRGLCHGSGAPGPDSATEPGSD